jgi:hypothetical protein
MFDLDDISAIVAENATTHWSREDGRRIENPNVFEWQM